jgi:trimeric autotransporter adhesin
MPSTMSLFRALVWAAVVSHLAPAQSYKIVTVAGGGLPHGAGVATPLGGHVMAVAADKSGNVYISLSDHHAVLRLSADGVLSPFAGNGWPGFGGDGGPAQEAQLFDPQGLAADADGNLYIADYGNNRVRKVANGVITTVAGNGLAGYSGDGGPAAVAALRAPEGLAVDSTGNLYIADRMNARIRRVSNGVISTVAGTGVAGFSGDGGPASSAQLSAPAKVALDSAGNLYIADFGNTRIRRVSDGIITTVAGNGTMGRTGDGGLAVNAQIDSQPGIAIGPGGALYIADGQNNRVRVVAGGVITTIAGGNVDGFAGDGGPAAQALLNQPYDIATDAAGNIYLAETGNYRVRKISGGMISTIAGGGAQPLSGPANAFELSYPSAVATAGNGDIYVADQGNFRVLKISRGEITRVAGNGTPGSSGDGGPALDAQVMPYGVAVDSAGNLYVSDVGSRVRKIANGVITTVAGTGLWGYSGDNGPAAQAQLYGPHGLAVDAAGNLYIAESAGQRVRMISNGVITTIAGTGTAGYSGDDGPATSARLNAPWAVAVDSAGAVYVAEWSGSRVRKIAGGIITTVAGNGVFGISGDGGPATAAQLYLPAGVAVDGSGNIFISDHARIRRVSDGIITTIAGAGGVGIESENGPALLAGLYGAEGIALDASGTVYIAETNSQRIRALFPTRACVSSSSARTAVRTRIPAPPAGRSPADPCGERLPF